MAKIIYIETSTELCSTALSDGRRIVACREACGQKIHASMTAVFVSEMLQEAGLSVGDCDAVCVGRGPGSYTGLRVGASTAKGLCFGAGIPLISVGTLDTLVWQYIAADPAAVDGVTDINAGGKTLTGTSEAGEGTIPLYKYIVPMIDARRMEVYTAVFRPDGTAVTAPEAKVVDQNSFADLLSEGPVLFIGDGAPKCSEVITHPDAHFVGCRPKASSMLTPALRAFAAGEFEDVAYFEPYYLKQFVATVSRRKLF